MIEIRFSIGAMLSQMQSASSLRQRRHAGLASAAAPVTISDGFDMRRYTPRRA